MKGFSNVLGVILTAVVFSIFMSSFPGMRGGNRFQAACHQNLVPETCGSVPSHDKSDRFKIKTFCLIIYVFLQCFPPLVRMKHSHFFVMFQKIVLNIPFQTSYTVFTSILRSSRFF